MTKFSGCSLIPGLTECKGKKRNINKQRIINDFSPQSAPMKHQVIPIYILYIRVFSFENLGCRKNIFYFHRLNDFHNIKLNSLVYLIKKRERLASSCILSHNLSLKLNLKISSIIRPTKK